MRRIVVRILLCAAGPCVAHADALEQKLQPFCAQSGIAAVACKCAGDIMRRSIPGSELDVILRFARKELSTEEIASCQMVAQPCAESSSTLGSRRRRNAASSHEPQAGYR